MYNTRILSDAGLSTRSCIHACRCKGYVIYIIDVARQGRLEGFYRVFLLKTPDLRLDKPVIDIWISESIYIIECCRGRG